MKNKKMFAAPLSFDGRIGRLEYLLTLLIVLTAVSVIVFFRLYGFINGDVESCIKYNSVPILTLTVWFELAQAIKRCHDIGYSGWVLLIPLMPIIILFIKGDEQNNEYNIQSINENEVAANIDYKSGTMGNSFVRFYLCMMMLFASGIITYLISWFNTTTGIVQNIGLTTQFLSKTIFFIGILLLFHYQKVGFYFVTYGGIFQFINCILYFKDILTSFLFTPITLMFGLFINFLYFISFIILHKALKDTSEWEKLKSGLKGINWKSILTYLLVLEIAKYIATRGVNS